MLKSKQPLQPVRKVISQTDKVITRECGHIKKISNPDQSWNWSICFDCPPLSDNWVRMRRATNGTEWVCKCGVGHYDPRLVKYTVHGCCSKGCCGRDDAPWRV